MKIGIYFGGFCPMHKGHEMVANKAIEDNDFVFIEVSGWKGEPRADYIGCPLEKRAELIAEYFGNKCNVFYQDDHEIGLDGSMSPENWTVWTKACFSHIIGKTAVNSKGETHLCTTDDHYVFYVGEQRYVDDIIKNQNVVPADNVSVELVYRGIIPISATAIRFDPNRHIDYVIEPFKNYLRKLC